MAFLRQLLEYLLLPPGLFILFILAGLLLALFRKRLAAVTLLAAGCLFLYLLAIHPVASALIRPLEDRYPPFQPGEELPFSLAAVVVLSGGSVPISPEEGGLPSPSPEAFKRLVYGASLARELGLPLILSGGRGPGNFAREPESLTNRRILAELGLAPQTVEIEGTSRDTWENAAEVHRVFHPSSVLLVTSAYHMRRALYAFEHNGVKCVAAPTDYKAFRTPFRLFDLIPGEDSLLSSTEALKEYAGFLAYRLRAG